MVPYLVGRRLVTGEDLFLSGAYKSIHEEGGEGKHKPNNLKKMNSASATMPACLQIWGKALRELSSPKFKFIIIFIVIPFTALSVC
jgi:hypothetical protein